MRSITAPFVVAPPAGARVQTRLRPSQQDAAVLRMVGGYLGGLAGGDLARRCAAGWGSDGRTDRKRALTAASSSRWAGTITRTSNDQWWQGWRNLLDARAGLRRAIRVIDRRLAGPVGARYGGTRGYATAQERWAKQQRLQHLQASLARVERRLTEGRVSVCRGGRQLAKVRHRLTDARFTEEQWRQQWAAERVFLAANGEADKPLGNETIRVHPEESWLELKLPAPLAHLANRPHGRYRLSCPVRFSHRAEEWAAQTTSGAVRYDIDYQPHRGRWYLSASWRRPAPPAVTVQQAVAGGVLAVDLNAGHLACRPPPATGGCAARSAPCWRSPRSGAAPRSASKTSTSPTLGRPAGRPLVEGGAASGSAGSWPGSRPGGSATGWSRWPPTAASRWWPWTQPGPPSGAKPTGSGHSKRGIHARRSPGTTRPAWCSGVARSGFGRGDGQVCPPPTSGWKPPQ